MNFKYYFVAASVLAACAGVSAASARVNLLADGGFKPVRMTGEVSAIRGWTIYDLSRRAYIGKYNRYLSGVGLFSLSEEDGVVKEVNFLGGKFPNPIK